MLFGVQHFVQHPLVTHTADIDGEDYRLAFTAHASRDVVPRVLVQLNGAPFTTWLEQRPTITTTTQSFEYFFTAGETECRGDETAPQE